MYVDVHACLGVCANVRAFICVCTYACVCVCNVFVILSLLNKKITINGQVILKQIKSIVMSPKIYNRFLPFRNFHVKVIN